MQENNDFIFIEDSVLTEETCASLIKGFNYVESCGGSYQRDSFEESYKRDTSVDFCQLHMEAISSLYDSHDVILAANQIHKRISEYVRKYNNGIDSAPPVSGDEKSVAIAPVLTTGHKIQRTRPSEGYHVWHCENNNITYKARCLSWILYLNDVEQGGETEFLYLSKRVNPKAGRLIIFPAGFTHTHRGNQPLSGEKYIATGWVEYAT